MALNAPSTTVRLPGTRRTGQAYTVIVDAHEVLNLIGSLEVALSGRSLTRFLQDDASEWFARDIESRFNEEGDVKSGFWPALSPATVRIRESLGYPGDGPINHRSGDLENFVTDERDFQTGASFASMDVPGQAGNSLLRRKLETAQIGSNNNPLGYGPTPPRPVLAIDPEGDTAAVLKLLNMFIIEHVATGLNGTFV